MTGWPRVRRLASILVCAALVVPLGVYATTQYVSGDTKVLVGQARLALHEIGLGHWVGWSGHFALLQQIPAGALVLAGLSDPHVIRGLVVLNILLLAAATWWAWRRLRRRSGLVAILFVAAILSGPMLWYGHASFSELMAAALTLAIVVLLLDRAGAALVILAMLGASIAKDTSLPFVVLLALGTAFTVARPGPPWYLRLRLPTIVVGTILSGIAVGGFNYLGFYRVTNPSNLDPKYFVPNLSIQVRFFFGIWLSPNGGVVTFWPTFAAFMLLAVAAAVAVARRSADWRGRAVALVPLATAASVLGGVSLGLSKWRAPLGWISWGPRLLLPWLVASAFLLGWAYAEQMEVLVVRLRRHALAVLIPLVLIVASLPQYVILFRPGLWDPLFATDAVCPRVPYIEQGATYYYQCTIHQLWSKHSVLLDAYSRHLGPTAFLLGTLCCAAWLWFTVNSLLSMRSSSPG